MSENETKAIAMKLAAFRKKIKLYLTFQNGLGAILYPWGYKLNATSDESKYVSKYIMYNYMCEVYVNIKEGRA